MDKWRLELVINKAIDNVAKGEKVKEEIWISHSDEEIFRKEMTNLGDEAAKRLDDIFYNVPEHWPLGTIWLLLRGEIDASKYRIRWENKKEVVDHDKINEEIFLQLTIEELWRILTSHRIDELDEDSFFGDL